MNIFDVGEGLSGGYPHPEFAVATPETDQEISDKERAEGAEARRSSWWHDIQSFEMDSRDIRFRKLTSEHNRPSANNEPTRGTRP